MRGTAEELERPCNIAAAKLAKAIGAETEGFIPLTTMVDAVPAAIELARQNEREACAELVRERMHSVVYAPNDKAALERMIELAAAIRARDKP